MNYKALKKIISTATGDQQSRDVSLDSPNMPSGNSLANYKTYFFFKIEREIEKVNRFYVQKESELKARLKFLIEKQRHLVSRDGRRYGNFSAQSLKDALNQFSQDLAKLQHFVEMNQTGFRKILKKWDKRSKSHVKELYISRQIDVQPCFNSDTLAELADQCLHSLSELNQLEIRDEVEQPLPDDTDHICQLIYSLSVDQLKEAFSQEKDLEKSASRVLWKVCGQSNGTIETVEKLQILKSVFSLDWNHRDDLSDHTCLHQAVKSNNVHVVAFLLSNGAAVDAQDLYGRTPLHSAVRSNNLDICELLLKAGASVECIDSEGSTPLTLAIQVQSKEIVLLLLKYGALVPKDSSNPDSMPLMLACYGGNAKIFSLLKERCQTSIFDQLVNLDGLSPIHIVCREGHTDILSLICNDRTKNMQDKYNRWTPLHYAASEGNIDCIQILLQHGADVNVKDDKKWFAATHAMWKGHVEIAGLLKNSMQKEDQFLHVVGSLSLNSPSPKSYNLLDDVLDMDSLPSLELPPPVIPIYGHSYLENKSRLYIKLHDQYLKNFEAIQLYRDKQIQSLKLIVSIHKAPSQTEKTQDDSSGMPYTVILPSQEAAEAFSFDILDTDGAYSVQFGLYNTFGKKMIGKAVLLSHDLNANQGFKCLSFLNPELRVIGEISISVQLTRPFVHLQLDLNNVGTYWKSTFQCESDTTITATSLQTEYIVIPVHLTSDCNPVVCTNGGMINLGKDIEFSVSCLTLSQFVRYSLALPLQMPQSSSIQDWTQYLDQCCFSLSELLHRIPQQLALCLDVKYQYSFEVNKHADAVLHSVFDSLVRTHEKKRSVILCSDDATLCKVLNLKQPNFAVFRQYRLQNMHKESLQQAIQAVKNSSLLGIICDVELLTQFPVFIKAIKDCGLVVSSLFGKEEPEKVQVIEKLKNYGVGGYLTDGVFHLTKSEIQ